MFDLTLPLGFSLILRSNRAKNSTFLLLMIKSVFQEVPYRFLNPEMSNFTEPGQKLENVPDRFLR